jgi:hypothetical protein
MVAFSEACTLAREQRNADALASFDKALAAAPRFVEALVNRGVVLPHHESASRTRCKAWMPRSRLIPRASTAWNNRGNALSRAGPPRR